MNGSSPASLLAAASSAAITIEVSVPRWWLGKRSSRAERPRPRTRFAGGREALVSRLSHRSLLTMVERCVQRRSSVRPSSLRAPLDPAHDLLDGHLPMAPARLSDHRPRSPPRATGDLGLQEVDSYEERDALAPVRQPPPGGLPRAGAQAPRCPRPHQAVGLRTARLPRPLSPGGRRTCRRRASRRRRRSRRTPAR